VLSLLVLAKSGKEQEEEGSENNCPFSIFLITQTIFMLS